MPVYEDSEHFDLSDLQHPSLEALGLLPREDFFERWNRLDDPSLKRLALIFRMRRDRAVFARLCWPDRFKFPFNECHDELLEKNRDRWDRRETIRDAMAAPRGIGKSTIASFVDPIHGIVFGLETFVLIFSAGKDLSNELVEDMKDAFEDEGTPLSRLFGPFDVIGGKTDFKVSVRGRPRVRVLSRSFQTFSRGPKYKGKRPSLIIVDDGERPDRVNNPAQRKFWWNFLTDDILKMGQREGGTAFYVRGTVLHPDSMLQNLLKHPGWDTAKYKSMITWPSSDAMKLWDQCGRIWTNLALGKARKRAARAFYELNKEAMDEGAEVLDPVAEPLYALFELIWAEGLRSFLREKQNEPRDPNSSFFNTEQFRYFRIEDRPGDGPTIVVDPIPGDEEATAKSGYSVAVRDLKKWMVLDPIPGKELGTMGEHVGSGAGDFAAIAVIGRDRYGNAFLLDVWMKRCRDTDMIEAMWALGERWGVNKAGIESNGFQRLVTRDFRKSRAKRREQKLWCGMSVVKIIQTLQKEDRIARLDAPLHQGFLMVNRAISRPVMEQIEEWPTGAHDDGWDAVEACYQLSGGNPLKMSDKPLGRR